MTPEFAATVQLLIVQTAPYLVAALVAYLLKAGLEAWNDFKARQPDAAAALENAAMMGVKAAEQTGLKNQWEQAGQAKYDLAFQLAQGLLEKQGLKLDGKLIGGAIEAAVLDLFPKTPAA